MRKVNIKDFSAPKMKVQGELKLITSENIRW